MVELQAHQLGWAEEFQREAVRLYNALGGLIDAVEHIGSTAVPSLLAKPIIDLAARVSISADPFAMDDDLAGLGYEQHSAGPKNHAVYVRSDSGRRTHILHVFNSDQWTYCNQRLFRDKLLHDADARRQYQALKRSLTGMVDGRQYTAAKRSLIEKLLNEERAARGLAPTSAWDK